MLTLRLYAPEDLRLEDMSGPICGTDEVKIRAKNCSTCGADVKIRKNEHQNLTPPRIIGHEIAGGVVKVGPGIAGDWGPDGRVQVTATIPCRRRHECRKGWMAVCQSQTSVGYQYDGDFVEYVIVPHEMLMIDDMNHIPDGAGSAETSVTEPFAYVTDAQEQLGIKPSDDMAIFGAGPIGCLYVRITRGVRRAGRIILVGTNSKRLKVSIDAVRPDVIINTSRVNIVEEIPKSIGGRDTDVIITAAPANIIQEQAVSMVARNGRISFFDGLPEMNPTITPDSNLVHYRQLYIYDANGSAPEHNRQTLDYIVSGGIPVAGPVTRRTRLHDVIDALGIVERGEVTGVTVEP